jgi:cell division FtsZ-interacting protein ZapD
MHTEELQKLDKQIEKNDAMLDDLRQKMVEAKSEETQKAAMEAIAAAEARGSKLLDQRASLLSRKRKASPGTCFIWFQLLESREVESWFEVTRCLCQNPHHRCALVFVCFFRLR